jgi:hypothetical protein
MLEVSLVAYAAEIRPVHVADLLSREGHPLAARVIAAAREARAKDAAPKEFDGGAVARRALGVAAGAMIVVGSVAAGVLGLNHGSTPGQTAAGEPVGAAPSNGPAKPSNQTPAPQAVAPYTNTAATQSAPQGSAPAGQIGAPAMVAPPAAQAPAPVQKVQPPPAAPAAPAAQQPAPAPQQSAPAAGPVQSLSAPVAQTVGGTTLDNTLAPVTKTVDNTLQPALSLIGGLLGR